MFVNPLTEKKFLPKNKQYDEVSSQIDYDLIMKKKREKEELNQNIKQLQEVKNCTFKPKINEVSQNLENGNRVPVYDRDLPGKKPSPPPRKEEGLEEMRNPHPKRKPNEKFYEEKVQWKMQ